MKLLVDIGNSRLKWTTAKSDGIDSTYFVDYRHADFLDQLLQPWKKLQGVVQLAIASVASKPITASVLELASQIWPGVEVVVPQASAEACGVKNAYLHPGLLGVDRWLALIGAHHHYSGACCIVDCGTAITVDLIEADGGHLGGLISPGLALMRTALARNTAALPMGTADAETNLAIETNTAIGNGTLLAAMGLIEAVMRRQASVCQLILTGGDARVIAGQLMMPCRVDNELVFKGLLRYCQVNDLR